MILANCGDVKIAGTKNLIQAEFCCLVAGMEKAGFTKEELLDSIEFGLKPEEELEKEVEAKKEEVLKNVNELLDRIFGKAGKNNGSK